MYNKMHRVFIPLVWLLNMVFLLGGIYTLTADENGQLPLIWLIVVGLLFLIFIYLIKDAIKLNRSLFNKIIGVILILSVPFYFFLQNIIIILPILILGIIIIKKEFTKNAKI